MNPGEVRSREALWRSGFGSRLTACEDAKDWTLEELRAWLRAVWDVVLGDD